MLGVGYNVGGLSRVGFVDVDGDSEGASLERDNRASVIENSTSRDLVDPVCSTVPMPTTSRFSDGLTKNSSGTKVLIIRRRRPDSLKVVLPSIALSMVMIGWFATPCWVRTIKILLLLRMNICGWDKRHRITSRELGDTGLSIHVCIASH